MATTYTIKTGDVLLCDINTTMAGSGVGAVLTIPDRSVASPFTGGTGGLLFNFHPGESVTKQLDKTIYVIRKPGIPTMYEIGLGERVFNITTTIKHPAPIAWNAAYTTSPILTYQSLLDLNYLCNYQYNKVITVGSKKSMGILNFYYYGDGLYPYFYRVSVKSLWYEQRPGAGNMFDLRIALTEVEVPG